MSDPPAAPTGPAIPAAEWPRDRKRVMAWCLYDWANSAFPTIVGTFVFSVYFARAVYGDETGGAAVWGYALSVAGLIVALASPVLGAIADHAGALKRWLGALTGVTALSACLLWFALPDPAYIAYTLIVVVVGMAAFDLLQVFYNALLTPNAPRGMLGRVSGWGWGIGYLGGLSALAATLVLFVGLGDALRPLVPLNEETAANIRAVGPLVAVWFVVFALPLFLIARDRPATGVPLGLAVKRGIGQLKATWRIARGEPGLLRFLIASALYRDGLATLFAVGGLYAAGVYGMSTPQILVFAIGLNVTAGLGAIAFAWVDDGVGSRRTVLMGLAGLIGIGGPILLVDDTTVFIALTLALGLFVGPAQAASRSLMAKLAPDAVETEMFGLYALTGKAAAVTGPALFALATDVFDTQRAGMAMILALFVVGGLILWPVREPERD